MSASGPRPLLSPVGIRPAWAPEEGDPLSAATYAELSSIVLGAEPLGAVLRRIAELAVKIVPGVDDAALTLVQNGRPRSVAVVGPVAALLDERQYERGFGPSLDVAISGQSIVLDTSHDTSYADYARQARRHGISHVASLAMLPLQRVSAALNIYTATGPFHPSALGTAQALARQAAPTVLNAAHFADAADEVTQMRQALVSRAGIEQAKGIIMSQHRCSADEAFAVLRDTSSRSNRKLRDVAQAVIEQATTG
jgi:hypothetical protein